MTLLDAQLGEEYIIKEIVTDDDLLSEHLEVIAVLFRSKMEDTTSTTSLQRQFQSKYQII